jgi:hypothetical protein
MTPLLGCAIEGDTPDEYPEPDPREVAQQYDDLRKRVEEYRDAHVTQFAAWWAYVQGFVTGDELDCYVIDREQARDLLFGEVDR